MTVPLPCSLDMDVVVVRAAIGQPVDQPRVAMEGEDDRLVPGEEFIEIDVVKPCACSVWGCSFMRSTTFTTLILQIGQMLFA